MLAAGAEDVCPTKKRSPRSLVTPWNIIGRFEADRLFGFRCSPEQPWLLWKWICALNYAFRRGKMHDNTDDNATALALVLTIARGWICDQNLMGRAAQSGSNAMHCRPKLTYEAEASEALRTHFALSEPVAKGDTTVTGKLAQNLRTRPKPARPHSLRVVRTCCEG